MHALDQPSVACFALFSGPRTCLEAWSAFDVVLSSSEALGCQLKNFSRPWRQLSIFPTAFRQKKSLVDVKLFYRTRRRSPSCRVVDLPNNKSLSSFWILSRRRLSRGIVARVHLQSWKSSLASRYVRLARPTCPSRFDETFTCVNIYDLNEFVWMGFWSGFAVSSEGGVGGYVLDPMLLITDQWRPFLVRFGACCVSFLAGRDKLIKNDFARLGRRQLISPEETEAKLVEWKLRQSAMRPKSPHAAFVKDYMDNYSNSPSELVFESPLLATRGGRGGGLRVAGGWVGGWVGGGLGGVREWKGGGLSTRTIVGQSAEAPSERRNFTGRRYLNAVHFPDNKGSQYVEGVPWSEIGHQTNDSVRISEVGTLLSSTIKLEQSRWYQFYVSTSR